MKLVTKNIHSLLIVLALLLSHTEKTYTQEIDTVPLFQIVQADPNYLASLCLGVGSIQGFGSVITMSALLSGDDTGFNFWSFSIPLTSRRDKSLLATCGLVLMPIGHPSTGMETLAILKIGDEEDFWSLVNSEVVRPISIEMLERIKDEKPISGAVVDDLEASAYCQFVLMAYQTAAEAFTQSARRDLTYADLMSQPKANRGEVVEVKGRLRRLRKVYVPQALQILGVAELYEGWVFQEIYGPNPICILLTQLPEDIKPFEKNDYVIEFQGYFFKKYRYKTANSGSENPWKDTPLLIGKTLKVTRGAPTDSDETTAWATGLLPVFVVFLVVIVSGIIGLIVWFLKSDRKIKSRLRNRNLEIDPLFKDYNEINGNQKQSLPSNLPEDTSRNSTFPSYKHFD